MKPEKKELIETIIILTHQSEEENLYPKINGKVCKNLLFIRRLKKIDPPKSVSELIKKDGKRLSNKRTISGGWAYIAIEKSKI